MKAIGVQVRAPVMDRNLVRLFHMTSARAHEAATRIALVKFLHIWRLRLLGHVPNK